MKEDTEKIRSNYKTPHITKTHALIHLRLAESEHIFHKRILSALSMPSFYRIWIIVKVCSMEFPLVKLRNFSDCRIPWPERLTVCMKKTDHITPVLKRLHQLPIKDKFIFKLLWTTHKSLNALTRCILTSCYIIALPVVLQ